MDAPARLAALAEDRSSGASEIARQARQALAAWGQDPGDPQPLREAVLGLVEAHPTMAPVVHLADEALTRLDDDPQALTELARTRPPERAIAEHAADELADHDPLVTYSRSGTVLAAIRAGLETTDLAVLVSEARPGGEGLDVARELAEAGADVRVTYDAALPGLVGGADLVLVGADAVTSEGFVNKAGTQALLAAARRSGTPTRLLAGADKLWPAALPREPSLEPTGRLDVDLPDAVDVHAPLFERVPLALVDRAVTEEGARDPEDLAREAEAIEVHPEVVEAVGSPG